jgi:Kef-type K+ transport system membrane component KefB
MSSFIVQLVVVVAVVRLLGKLARKVGQPAVVAEILGGILLGPSVLGAVAPSVSASLFPAGSLDPLRAASELGAVLFAFLVGLELDPAMLKGRARITLTVSVAGIALPLALGAAAAFPIHDAVAGGAPSTELVLFLGAAMAVTAFPVLTRILAEHRLLRTRIGALAVASAALQDAITWCLLAFVIAFTRSGGLARAAATTGLAAALVATLLLVVRPVLERLVDRMNAPLMLTHDIVALALLGALGSAWLSDRIGVHLLFGAFLFGAIVPKRDGFAHALVDKLESVITVLLIPLFFVVSGLRTHIELVGSTTTAVACIAIIVVACAGKIGGTLLAGRICGLSWRDASALGVMLNTRGLMELIVINVGFELGVFSSAIFSMMVVMVIATSLIAVPVLSRVYPERDAIRDLLASGPPAPLPARSDRILACISDPRIGPAMIGIAAALAGKHTEVVALHLTRDDDDDSDGLAPALARADELALTTRPLAFASTNPADDILRVADVRTPELVVLEHGDVARDVLRHAECQIAVFVDRGLPARPARVVAPLDDGVASRLAERIARSTGAELVTLSEHVEARHDDLWVVSHERDCSASLLIVHAAKVTA